MGYSLVTEVEKEVPNRMKISHCIRFFTGFLQDLDHIISADKAFSHQLCGPLSVAASVKYLVLFLTTANKKLLLELIL